MAGNSFGQIFKIITFGESHGLGIGVVIDGCPAGLTLDFEKIQHDLNRRKPGQSSITTTRSEDDAVEIISGVFDAITLGSPIAMLVKNKDHRSADYDTVKNAYRPSHADFTTEAKYGIRDYRGGGRSSARETIARVASGAIAKQLLATENISIQAYVSQVGDVKCTIPYTLLNLEEAEKSIVRCPDAATATKMIAKIDEVRQDGDSIGGVITCVIKNCPAGLGEPVFDKLHADLAKAMMSINATRAFEIGDGFDAVTMRGSMHNDAFANQDGKIVTTTNHSAGIQGGISNGMDIYFRVAFKPVATISKQQQTVTTDKEETTLEVTGRHDPCVVPRAVPIVEAMAALVLADHWLRQRSAKL